MRARLAQCQSLSPGLAAGVCDLPQDSSVACACGQGVPARADMLGPPASPSAVALGLILPRQPCPTATPFPAATPIPSPGSAAKQGSVEKPSSYRSTMSAMVQANMRSPSGICRATGKKNSPRVRRGWRGCPKTGT